MPEPDVMAIHQLAALLRVGLKTVYTLAQNGEVHGTRTMERVVGDSRSRAKPKHVSRFRTCRHAPFARR